MDIRPQRKPALRKDRNNLRNNLNIRRKSRRTRNRNRNLGSMEKDSSYEIQIKENKYPWNRSDATTCSSLIVLWFDVHDINL